MNRTPAFITIDPIDPEHKQVLAAAIKHRDTDALDALRGNLHKPIDFVTQWFLYSMMTDGSGIEKDSVVIYSPEVRQNIHRFNHNLEHPDEPYIPFRLAIPMDLYDFLL